MGKETAKATFGFTYPELLMKTSFMLDLFKRDEYKFNEFGFPSEMINEFEVNCEELNRQSSDLEMETKKMVAVQNKNKTADELLAMLKRLIIYAKQVYDADSYDLKPFIIENPAKLSDAELCFHADILARYTKSNIEDFKEVTNIEMFCNEMILKNETFKLQHAEIKTRIKERDKATEKRWAKANEVYKQMMRICEIGKFMWESESEAYYNDYLIYPNTKNNQSSKSKTKPEDEDDAVG